MTEKDPGRTGGARAPLFDRLAQPGPRERGLAYAPAGPDAGPARVQVLDRAALRASVRRELERLLNTRCALSPEVLKGRERTVLEYGVPDFTHLHTRDPATRSRIAADVEEAVRAYEPRLRHPRAIVSEGGSERGLKVRLDGLLVVGEVAEEVTFAELPVGKWTG